MRVDVELSPTAIDDIRRYIVERAGFDAAEAYLDRIIDRCQSVGVAPLTGTPRDDLASGLRTIPFERRATIVYSVAVDRVVIQRVLHAGRDLGRAFDA